MDGLKPCPFCGGTNPVGMIRKSDGWSEWFLVLCDCGDGGCGANGGWRQTENAAAEAWNRRAE